MADAIPQPQDIQLPVLPAGAQLTPQDVVTIVLTLLGSLNGRVRLINGEFGLPNLGSNPGNGFTGQLAVVGGKLKIWDGSAWTIVGTQS